MNDINDILRNLLDQYSNPGDVDDAFAQMLKEDEELQADYDEWCFANGYDPKRGHKDYLDELIDSRDSIWENINE